MVELKVCRICLSRDVKMYKFDQYQLKYYYEQVMAKKVNAKDGLPQWFCFECAAVLHKFHKFKEKCYGGQRALMEIQWKGPITYESVSKVDRHGKNLQSSLDIINNKRVKICLIQHKTATGRYKKQIIQTADPVIESYLSVDVQDEAIAQTETVTKDPIDVQKKEIDDVKIEIDDIPTNIDEEMVEVPIEINDNILQVHEKVLPIVDKIEDTSTQLCKEQKSSIDDKAQPNNLKRKRKNNEKIKYIITYNKSYKRKKTEENNGIKKFKKIQPKRRFVNEENWQKLNLSEEEAVKEFKAREKCPTYLKSSYQCTHCMRGFSKLDMFERHMKMRHSEIGHPLECHFCHMRFQLKYQLSRHLKRHYVIYKCKRCEMRFYWESAANFHNDYHNNVIKTCEHCKKEFRHTSTYYTHLRIHHRSTHVCAFCGETFVSKIGLLQHTRMKHITDDKPTNEEGTGKYCEQCDVKFVTLGAYDKHLTQSALHPESYKNTEETPKTSPRPLLKKSKRLQKIPTTCTQCGKHFSSQIGWRRHHKAEHSNVPLALNDRRICEICGASLALASMQSHMNTHTRKITHPCPTCGMSFVSKQNMERHQLRHTGEKPVKCRVVECDKRFTQVASMNLHYRTFHLKLPYPKRNRRKKNE